MAEKKNSKFRLRQALIEKRQGIDPDSRTAWDAAIARQTAVLLANVSAQVLGIYWPIRGEPDLRAAYEQWAARGMHFALPTVIDKNAPLKFVSWAPGEALVKDAMGVMVPAAGATIEPDALLLPCVGFNAARLRLGYGGGLYDRTLAAATRPLAIGLAYACTQADFDAEAHDVALDWIVTEQAVWPAPEKT